MPSSTIDLLIANFKEVKEELAKSDKPLLHSTVEGFMTGLKALPKGSADRGKFITAHMSHGPFLGALQAHPQGKQVHSMLTNHLNSASNAGFKPGQTQAVVKADDLDDDLDKALLTPGHKQAMTMDASRAAHQAFVNKPVLTKPHKQAMPSPEEHANRASMFADFTPPPGVKKNINGSYDAQPNMAMSYDEKISLCKNGQWELKKDLDSAIKQLKSSTKVTSAMNDLRGKQPAVAVVKDEDKK